MKELLPIVGAGTTFAATALVGLLAGILVARLTNQPAWVAGGLFAGLLLGGYSAYRLLTRSLR